MKSIYPICASTFRKWCKSNSKYEQIYNSLGKPKPFDVSLRDGLQGLTKEQQKNVLVNDKLIIYEDIVKNHEVTNIEVGSLVSKNVLPIFQDSISLLRYLNNKQQNSNERNHFILVPNNEKLNTVINIPGVNKFSFITSVSNSFQLKNTKMSLKDTDNEIFTMLYNLDENNNQKKKAYIKLYVSCVTECPIEGKIDNDFIVNRLLTLNKMEVDNICISDTCGTLEIDDFEYIVDTCKFFGLPMTKLSLHLHVKPEREKIVETIIYKALERNITNFDVSVLENGGCSVTMEKSNLCPNLSYNLYYKCLVNYILKKTNI